MYFVRKLNRGYEGVETDKILLGVPESLLEARYVVELGKRNGKVVTYSESVIDRARLPISVFEDDRVMRDLDYCLVDGRVPQLVNGVAIEADVDRIKEAVHSCTAHLEAHALIDGMRYLDETGVYLPQGSLVHEWGDDSPIFIPGPVESELRYSRGFKPGTSYKRLIIHPTTLRAAAFIEQRFRRFGRLPDRFDMLSVSHIAVPPRLIGDKDSLALIESQLADGKVLTLRMHCDDRAEAEQIMARYNTRFDRYRGENSNFGEIGLTILGTTYMDTW